MEANFWHERWHKNEIGFHEDEGSQLLKSYVEGLELSPTAKIFVPLCGKTRDIAWLLSKGFNVAGIELNELAVNQLFEELQITPIISKVDSKLANSCNIGLKRFYYTYKNGLTIDIYQGDFFALRESHLGSIDAIYDRAALVALPSKMRIKYTEHLLTISENCQQLLVCFEYADGLLKGPPHSIVKSEVDSHYQSVYLVEQVYKDRVENGFKGQVDVFEAVYLLKPKNL